MRRHKTGGEPARTAPPRAPPAPTTLDAFRDHYARTVAFTDALREGRCRRTRHFDERLEETIAAFRPVFATWNMEILFVLYMRGALRFNALRRAVGGASARVLTDKLRALADEGLVSRRQDGDAVHYALTERGEAVARHLHPLLFHLHNPDALTFRAASGSRA